MAILVFLLILPSYNVKFSKFLVFLIFNLNFLD